MPLSRRLSAYTHFSRLLTLRDRLAELFCRPARNRRPARLAVESLEERVVPAYTAVEFSTATSTSTLVSIARGSDGNIWYIQYNDGGDRIGRVTPDGDVSDAVLYSPWRDRWQPFDLAAGPDGNLWMSSGTIDGDPGYVNPGDLTFTRYADSFTGLLAGPPGTGVWYRVAAGPDGRVWFVSFDSRIVVAAVSTDLSASAMYPFDLTSTSQFDQAYGLAAGPDGNLWVTARYATVEYDEDGPIYPPDFHPVVYVVGTDGAVVHSYDVPTMPGDITAGPDGNMWFTAGTKIDRITPGGTVTEFSIPSGGTATAIAVGPDGNMWFTETATDKVGFVTPGGEFTEFSLTSGRHPNDIVGGDDGRVWFTETGSSKVAYITPFTVTAPADCGCPCQPTIIPLSPFVAPANPNQSSSNPVRYADGVVTMTAYDLSSDGVGVAWGQTRSWTNALGYADGGTNGNGWVVSQAPRLVQLNGTASLAVVADGTTAFVFDQQVGGDYKLRFAGAETLGYDSGSGTYTLTTGTGDVIVFDDFTAAPAGRRGQFASMTSAGGVVTEVTDWTTGGAIEEVQASFGSIVESYLYAYVSSGVNAGLLSSVTLRRSTNSGSTWATVRSVEYAYYDGTAAGGSAGDLKTATIKDADGNPVSTDYYRYYTAGEANGYAHGLKYAVLGAAYDALKAAAGGTDADVFAADDEDVAPYADNYFEYDWQHRATKEVAGGAGCSVCSAGQGTFTYEYATSDNAAGPNSWKTKTVETLADGNTNTVYTNAAGNVMLKAYTDTTASLTWITYYRYDDDGRVVLVADPSAVTGYDDSYGDLVHYVSGNAAYLSDTTGLLTQYVYGASTTATDSTAGDVAGYLKETDLQHGETGTLGNGRLVPQSSQTYIVRTADDQDFYFQASSTVYRNDDGTGGETTTYSYTWQGDTAQPASKTTTLPTVTTGQNGSNSATSTTQVYDAQGRVVWSKDAGGFITYTEYDPATGAVVRTIQDVDDGAEDIPELPDEWETPGGGGLHLTTTYEVDDKGRTTKVTHPDGVVDYTVYDDANHEVRYYAGWDSDTGRPSGPTVVTREDVTGGYSETLTMSAAPHLTDGVPDGTEGISQVQSLSRSYWNDAGQVVYSDSYFNLAGLTYSTSTSLGTEGENFYRTRYQYDDGGRLNKTVSPLGTITRTVYDGQGRAVSEWIGTDDTPTTGYWSTTNLTGTDMVKVREYEYDGGGVGDGKLTKVTEYPGGGADPRVTQTYYDWRGRAVAMKVGVESSEDAGVNRPITYAVYDNLGEVTESRLYDGDGVTVTFTSGVPDAPSSSLLRAKSTASYDELGRAYRTDTYSVDPSDGTVGSHTLYSLTWYDARGQVVKTVAPGGLVTKYAYDGAGRLTTTYQTDGGGDSTYSDALTATGDTVLEQDETQYDAGGKVLVSITRQRFHDASGTGALGTPSTGVYARVSYTAYYYDAGGRLVETADVGTNGGAAFEYDPEDVPTRDADHLVTTYEYGADAVQDIWLTGAVSGGTFTLTVGGYTTGGIAYNASASAVQSALEALSSVGSGNVAVTATADGWEVRFTGDLAGTYMPMINGNPTGLAGGGMPSVYGRVVSAGGDTGGAAVVTDPLGRVNRSYRDNLGRVVRTVENFVDGVVSAADDKTTEFTYNAAGMTSLTARLVGGGGQTTAWVYGVAAGTGSAITSNDIVGATEYPDPTTGAASSSEKESVTVNALGETVTSTDRNGTTHTLTYDLLGRVVSDAVTAFGSGVDDTVARIDTAYDARGNAYLVTSYDGDDDVVNQVLREFNGLGQLTAEYQSHGGEVDTETTPAVVYAYSEMPSGADHSRLVSVTYPSGYELDYNYASGLDGNISRLSSLSDTTGTLEAYSYLGLSTAVIRSHPQVGAAGLDLTLVKQSGEDDGDAGDQYTGLDRFGRVVDQRWLDVDSGDATDRFQYGYDAGGNRLYRDNLVNAAFGEVYTYDGQNQLASFARGTLNGSKDGISGSAAATSDWTYDALGNWAGVSVDGGSAQERTANAQNEITGIDGETTPTYDADGNMTGDETGRKYVYDAWNRLVAVTNSAGTVTLVAYTYDGLGRQVTRTEGGTTTDLYYSDQRQVLEEQQGGDTTNRYVWSPVYVDALVLRDRATTTPGTLDERMWVQQDANWNVTALVTGAGAVVERYVYAPFGQVTVYSPTYGTVRTTSLYAETYFYQGRPIDSVTGDYNNRGRWYSPTLGRPIQLDPLLFGAGDVNPYRWEANDPTGRLDPSGFLANPPVGPGAGGLLLPTTGGGATTGGVGAGGLTIGAVGFWAGIVALPIVIGGGAIVVAIYADELGYWIEGVDPAYIASAVTQTQNFARVRLDPLRPRVDIDCPKKEKNSPCFPAGTPIRTPEGWKPIEHVRAGELVLSRDEYDPSGAVAAKRVEEVFSGAGLLWNLHVGGEVIQTTAEHPFYVQYRGWVPCHELRIGDRLATQDGRWLPVEDLLDTGEWVALYNFRVTDYHTYFIGCDNWGFSVWAHNACEAIVYWYAPGTFAGVNARNLPHLSVETINSSGDHVHTDMIDGGTSGTEITSVPPDVAALSSHQARIPLPNADAAQVYQSSLIGTAGPAWSYTNNCFTHVGEVLAAGGVQGANTVAFLTLMRNAFGFNIFTGIP